MRLLLLVHLSYMLLLSFVLLESFFRLIRGQFRMGSPLREVWIVTRGLLLLSQVLVLRFQLSRVAIVTIATIDAVLVLSSTHHDHSSLALDWYSLRLCRLWVVLLAVVCRELVFVLQEWVLTYVVLLLMRELLANRSHHTWIFAWRSINLINLLLALVETIAPRLVRFNTVVRILVRNSAFYISSDYQKELTLLLALATLILVVKNSLHIWLVCPGHSCCWGHVPIAHYQTGWHSRVYGNGSRTSAFRSGVKVFHASHMHF